MFGLTLAQWLVIVQNLPALFQALTALAPLLKTVLGVVEDLKKSGLTEEEAHRKVGLMLAAPHRMTRAEEDLWMRNASKLGE